MISTFTYSYSLTPTTAGDFLKFWKQIGGYYATSSSVKSVHDIVGANLLLNKNDDPLKKSVSAEYVSTLRGNKRVYVAHPLTVKNLELMSETQTFADCLLIGVRLGKTKYTQCVYYTSTSMIFEWEYINDDNFDSLTASELESRTRQELNKVGLDILQLSVCGRRVRGILKLIKD